MTHVIRIDPWGEVTPVDLTSANIAAEAAFAGQVGCVTLNHPICPRFPPLIGYIHDWGATTGMALNRKAWALYGRSPIFGPMFVCDDEGEPLDDDFVAQVTSGAFITADIDAAMDAFLLRNP